MNSSDSDSCLVEVVLALLELLVPLSETPDTTLLVIAIAELNVSE
jgi:hypothetical protein